jgi:hypothetical protein
LAQQLAAGITVQKFPASSSLVAFGRGTQARNLFLEQRPDGGMGSPLTNFGFPLFLLEFAAWLFWTKPGAKTGGSVSATGDDAEASSAPLSEVVDVVAGMATQARV